MVVAIGASIHATEVGGTQAASELLHSLATSTDPGILTVLQNVVIILIPSLNPDGHRLIVDWYRKWKGTPFEGGPMPWLYHEYVGHDINRDAFMMNMAENRTLARFFYRRWHPQVFLTMHQMGPNGPRFFVPPNVDPIDRNYDPLIWRTAASSGTRWRWRSKRTAAAGVVSNALYDYYWPGYEDSAPLGHNTVSLLTEVASVPRRLADDRRRSGSARRPRLSEYRPQINFPDPWPGGDWTPARYRRLRPVGGARPAQRGGALIASRSSRTSTRWAGARSRPGRRAGRSPSSSRRINTTRTQPRS